MGEVFGAVTGQVVVRLMTEIDTIYSPHFPQSNGFVELEQQIQTVKPPLEKAGVAKSDILIMVTTMLILRSTSIDNQLYLPQQNSILAVHVEMSDRSVNRDESRARLLQRQDQHIMLYLEPRTRGILDN